MRATADKWRVRTNGSVTGKPPTLSPLFPSIGVFGWPKVHSRVGLGHTTTGMQTT